MSEQSAGVADEVAYWRDRAIRAEAGRDRASGAAPGAPAPAASGQRPRGALARRLAVRTYLALRPAALPVITRLHALLGRLLQYEEASGRQGAAAGAAAANADLLRSIEAAMLTLALQRRDDGT